MLSTLFQVVVIRVLMFLYSSKFIIIICIVWINIGVAFCLGEDSPVADMTAISNISLSDSVITS